MNPRFLVIALVSLAVLLTVGAPASTAERHRANDEGAVLEIDSFVVPNQPGKFQTFHVTCRSGYSAIVGTLREIPPGIFVGTSTTSGPNGRVWTFELENSSGADLKILVQVRCVQDVVLKRAAAGVSVEPGSRTEVGAKCPSGFTAVGRGEHVSAPGPPATDDFAAFFSVYLVHMGIDENDVGVTDVLDALDFYDYLVCVKAAIEGDKAPGKKPKLKTKTVKGSVDAQPFNFAQIDLKCPRGYSPTTPAWGPLPEKVKGFADIPGTKTTQPVRFLNGTANQQHLEGSLLCIKIA